MRWELMVSCFNLQLPPNGQGISEGRVLVACCSAAEIPIERGWWFM